MTGQGDATGKEEAANKLAAGIWQGTTRRIHKYNSGEPDKNLMRTIAMVVACENGSNMPTLLEAIQSSHLRRGLLLRLSHVRKRCAYGS